MTTAAVGFGVERCSEQGLAHDVCSGTAVGDKSSASRVGAVSLLVRGGGGTPTLVATAPVSHQFEHPETTHALYMHLAFN